MPVTVLYVEDNDDNVQLVRQILRLRPHIDLIVATTGREGARLAAERLPALILLDRRLPDVRGEDVLAQLSADEITEIIPVIVFSGDAINGAETALFPGANGFLPKPFELTDLLATVDRYAPAN